MLPTEGAHPTWQQKYSSVFPEALQLMWDFISMLLIHKFRKKCVTFREQS